MDCSAVWNNDVARTRKPMNLARNTKHFTVAMIANKRPKKLATICMVVKETAQAREWNDRCPARTEGFCRLNVESKNDLDTAKRMTWSVDGALAIGQLVWLRKGGLAKRPRERFE